MDNPAPVVPKRQGAHGEITDAEIINTIRETHGFISVAARKLGCSTRMIQYRAERSDALRDAIQEVQEDRLDLAENKLMVAIGKGEPWAIKFFLAYKGRSRGYKETQSIEAKPSQEQEATRISDEKLDQMLEENRRKRLRNECQPPIDIKEK